MSSGRATFARQDSNTQFFNFDDDFEGFVLPIPEAKTLDQVDDFNFDDQLDDMNIDMNDVSWRI